MVIVCAGLGGNGAVANVALRQARELAKYYRVTCISNTLPFDREVTIEYEQVVTPDYFWLRRLGHVAREYAFTRYARRKIEEILRRSEIDIIICHSHPVMAYTCGALRQRSGIFLVIITHGDIFERPKGTYDPVLAWFYKRATPVAYKLADLVIALSPAMRKLALKGGAAPECIDVIPNGIELADIGLGGGPVIKRISIDTKTLRLLYVGRLSLEKGVDILLDACGSLMRDGVDFHLDIYGDGVEKRKLEQQVSTLELINHVAFHGNACRQALGSLYCSHHLLCVPSRSDTLPTVVLEAIASETPVIGARVGGIPFLLGDDFGFTFDPGVGESMAKAIKAVYLDRAKIEKVRAACNKLDKNGLGWIGVGSKLKDSISRRIES